MKNKLGFILAIFFLGLLACSSSQKFVETAVAQTLAAQPTLTATLAPTVTESSPTPTLASTPDIRYSEDFSDPESGWPVVESTSEGISRYFEGEYSITRPQGEDLVTWQFARHTLYDGVVSIDYRHVSGDPIQTTAVIYWRVAVDSSAYYVLSTNSDGQFAVHKAEKSELSLIQDWLASSAIKRGKKVNHVDILCSGVTNEIYINGELVASFRDSTSLIGDIAVGAGSSPVSAVEIAFDNLVVYSLDGWTPIDTYSIRN